MRLLILSILFISSAIAQTTSIQHGSENKYISASAIESSVTASDSETDIETKAQDDGDDMQSEDEAKSWLLRSIAQVNRSIRWAYIGADGELIILPDDIYPNDYMVSIVKDEVSKGFVVLDTGDRLGEVLLNISEQGNVTFSEEFRQRSGNTKYTPLRWPFMEKKKAKLPPHWAVVSEKNSRAKKRRVDGALGWLILDRYRNLHAPLGADIEPLGGAVWVFRAPDDGLILKRNDALYCTVLKDRSIEYDPDMDGDFESGDCHWSFVDEAGHPAMLRPGDYQLGCGSQQEPEVYIEGGGSEISLWKRDEK